MFKIYAKKGLGKQITFWICNIHVRRKLTSIQNIIFYISCYYIVQVVHFFYNIHVFLSICLVYKNSKSFKYLNFSHPCHLYRQNEYQIHVVNLKLEIDQSELFLFAKFIQEKFCKTRMYLLLGISNFQLFSATYIIFLYHQQVKSTHSNIIETISVNRSPLCVGLGVMGWERSSKSGFPYPLPDFPSDMCMLKTVKIIPCQDIQISVHFVKSNTDVHQPLFWKRLEYSSLFSYLLIGMIYIYIQCVCDLPHSKL